MQDFNEWPRHGDGRAQGAGVCGQHRSLRAGGPEGRAESWGERSAGRCGLGPGTRRQKYFFNPSPVRGGTMEVLYRHTQTLVTGRQMQ
jgi:hypothetical protein